MPLINGQDSNKIAISDRGLNYGDGVFETIAVYNSIPIFWQQHFNRLHTSCHKLGIHPPEFVPLIEESKQLIKQSSGRDGINRIKGILKIIITRGEGTRGYKPQYNLQSTRVINYFPWPKDIEQRAIAGIKVFLCQTPLAKQPYLAGIKHLNRLEQVLASMEWDGQLFSEGLMFDTDGYLISGTKSNVFLISSGKIITPNIAESGIDGIIRQQVLLMATELQLELEIKHLTKTDLLNADEVFVTNSITGIWPVLNWNPNKRWPITRLLQHGLQQRMEQDTHENKFCI